MEHPSGASPEVIARDVLDGLHEGCQVVSPDWTYLYVNEEVARQAHREPGELIGRRMVDCFPGIDRTAMFAVLRRCMVERTPQRMENEFHRADGSRGTFDLRFLPVPEGVCILSLDVTDARRTALALARSEERLRQIQKMDAIGHLAGGVAHDFNNLLTVIMSYTDLLLDRLPADDPAVTDLEEIRKAGERAAQLTRQLLTFSRRNVVARGISDLNVTVRDMEKMMQRLLRAGIVIRLELTEGLGNVLADTGQVEQVVLNLIVNARDAMPEGGTVTVATRAEQLDAETAAESLGIPPGAYAVLEVRDTGSGMDRHTQEHIFEPFFTTKPAGEGTGLGLATVYGIVHQNGGSISVLSEPGLGTTFRIYLPLTEDRPASEVAPAPISTLRGNETILLVDDDEQIRHVTGAILRSAGYSVVEARNGTEAVLACERLGSPLHLIVTDVVMPHMGGSELAVYASRIRPGVPVLFVSGYTADRLPLSDVLVRSSILPKPFTPARLLRHVRETLDGPAGV